MLIEEGYIHVVHIVREVEEDTFGVKSSKIKKKR